MVIEGRGAPSATASNTAAVMTTEEGDRVTGPLGEQVIVTVCSQETQGHSYGHGNSKHATSLPWKGIQHTAHTHTGPSTQADYEERKCSATSVPSK